MYRNATMFSRIHTHIPIHVLLALTVIIGDPYLVYRGHRTRPCDLS